MAKHVNKVVVNGIVRLDLTSDTVNPDSLIEGVQAHDSSGAVILGALSIRSIDDLQISPGYIIVPPGVYPKGVLIDSTYTYAIEPNFEFPFSNESLTQKLIDMGRVREL